MYSRAKEVIPDDIPEPKGKYDVTTHYVDANLHHDLTTGKAVTAVLHWHDLTLGKASMLFQQNSAQMGNILAEQQVNYNKVKTKQQTQEQLSSPLS